VKQYTSGAPFMRPPSIAKLTVNSNPPTIGPLAFAIWKIVAPQVTAFTKCSFGTSVGSSELIAGPLKHRPVPITKRMP